MREEQQDRDAYSPVDGVRGRGGDATLGVARCLHMYPSLAQGSRGRGGATAGVASRVAQPGRLKVRADFQLPPRTLGDSTRENPHFNTIQATTRSPSSVCVNSPGSGRSGSRQATIRIGPLTGRCSRRVCPSTWTPQLPSCCPARPSYAYIDELCRTDPAKHTSKIVSITC